MNNCLINQIERLRRFSRNPRSGVTIVEIMMALAASLLLIAAMAQVFQMIGRTINTNRAVIELLGRMRGVTLRLQEDLKGLTTPLRPWTDMPGGAGYFEYFEGGATDANSNRNFAGGVPVLDVTEGAAYNTSFGDVDDILAFTTRSTGEPFRGQVLGQLVPQEDGTLKVVNPGHLLYNAGLPPITEIESEVAEIIWYTVFADSDGDNELEPNLRETVTLYRRVLLVRPDLDMNDAGDTNLLTNLYVTSPQDFYSQNDISVHYTMSAAPPAGVLITNSLLGLEKRENRWGHLRDRVAAPAVLYPATFPHPIVPALLTPKTGNLTGEDVMLSHALAFDAKAYDPYAPVQSSNPTGGSDPTDALVPSDPGYQFDSAATIVGQGAFVDLFYARGYPPFYGTSHFSGFPNGRSQLAGATYPQSATYEPWTLQYEYDGANQDPASFYGPLVDQGLNGLDDNLGNGVDDILERETSPPYNVPLRGIQVTVRAIEPDSRQVRQTSVTINFKAE